MLSASLTAPCRSAAPRCGRALGHRVPAGMLHSARGSLPAGSRWAAQAAPEDERSRQAPGAETAFEADAGAGSGSPAKSAPGSATGDDGQGTVWTTNVEYVTADFTHFRNGAAIGKIAKMKRQLYELDDWVEVGKAVAILTLEGAEVKVVSGHTGYLGGWKKFTDPEQAGPEATKVMHGDEVAWLNRIQG